MDDRYRQKIIKLAGEAGRKWLDDLPNIIKRYERELEVTALPPFDLSYNYVAPAKNNSGDDIVLKISFPNNKEFPDEIEALNFFDGQAAIKLLKESRDGQALVLEKAVPGNLLRGVKNDQELISIAAVVIRNLHKPIKSPHHPFPTVTNWAEAFYRYKQKYQTDGPIPKQLFDKAEGITREYLQDKKETVLLHGDLHSDNILKSQRGWVVIDPKGVIGEPEFELAAFLRNPLYDLPKGSDYKQLEISRISQFSEELGFYKQRILNWAFVGAVLSIIWFLEDEKEFKEIYLRNAELLDQIKI